MDKIAYLSAKNLVSEIKSKSISSVELTELYINRIEEYDVAINAVVVRTFDQVLEDAKKADITSAKGEDLGPLHGLLMTIKESYVIKDTSNLGQCSF
tara:strand:+ start:98 stop:388 length:291 start_codon:yes stop_codon:yes gene_type:complete